MKQKNRTKSSRKEIYRHLQYRITAFCAILTGLVLFIACAISFHAAKREIQSAAQSLFLSQSQTANAYLSAPGSVDTQSLLQFAEQCDLSVAVVDGGTLLTFTPTLTAEMRDALLAELKEDAVGETLYSSKAQSGTFVLTAAGKEWRAALQNHSASTTQWYNVLVLQPMTTDVSRVVRLLVQYAVVFCIAWAALIIVAAWLSKRVIRPVEAAHTEQLRFLAGASHELKTPLAVISTSVDLLRRGVSDPEEPCQTIQRETRQMARLIDDMLVLTNGGTGRWELQLQPLVPEDISMSVYEKFVPIFAQKAQELTLQLPDTALPSVFADEQRLEQILSILLDNAHSYAPEGSSVQLRVDQCEEGKTRFWVVDHGPGIPDEEKQAVFHYFYRREAQQQQAPNKAGHYGLGLSVATELARLQQGSLTVLDTPGGGATFCLTVCSA